MIKKNNLNNKFIRLVKKISNMSSNQFVNKTEVNNTKLSNDRKTKIRWLFKVF